MLTNGLGALWAVSLVLILWFQPESMRSLMTLSLVYPAYYTVLSLWLEFARLREATAGA